MWLIKKTFRYFLAGLAVLLPLSLTMFVLFYLISKLKELTNFNFSIIQYLILFFIIVALGVLSSMYFWSSVGEYFDKLLKRIPVIGFLYKSIKDITMVFVGKDKKFTEPVLVKMSQSELYKVGFITNKAAESITGLDSSKELYAVYFPISFSIAGDLYLVPIDRITVLQQKPKDIMQYVLSGGVINLEEESID
ncbi:MAG TPA: DUF502 domain-containing protein [Saprospiraceae bacterium]|nr:DUF502 domain-containing protein [Saprospiraceae bacterium]MCB9328023.1 DUF502 domain-containing protein [Lewinellaceae bacterium]HPK09547.1 DUF502 domain-containing protein [Saprospiraceae bacterium]HRX28648.1 DUF502 domain-containing protein [Saprospiraceae bacterium]